MRTITGIAMLAVLAGCSGSGAAAEQVQAANLLHGLKDKATLQGTPISLTNASPATFQIGSAPEQGSTITITKLGKCKYQSYFDQNGKSIIKFTTDLTGLVTDGYTENQLYARQFKGASVVCESVKELKFDPAAPMSGNMCASIGPVPGLLLAFSKISGPDLSALATKFKRDFCQ
ncbi:hypothetical protein NKJ06_22725 [Mesorhizobium sp. M0293]|uniref:hypothetical protein n=1 Tax=Mesorhizobium sp. M0293 TaxID=2956930 RepID=UPI00333CD3B9